MANRLTIKGQVTIPKGIRDFLNLASGNQVEFRIAADGSVTLTKAETQTKSTFASQPHEQAAAPRKTRQGIDVLSLLSGVCI